MKNIIKIVVIAILALLLIPFVILAQDSTGVDTTVVVKPTFTDWNSLVELWKQVIGTPEQFSVLLSLVYAFLLYILSFFSSITPVLRKIPDTWERVIVTAIVLAVGFSGVVYKFDVNLMDLLTMAFGFIVSAKVVHPVVDGYGIKTPKVEEKKV